MSSAGQEEEHGQMKGTGPEQGGEHGPEQGGEHDKQHCGLWGTNMPLTLFFVYLKYTSISRSETKKYQTYGPWGCNLEVLESGSQSFS